jgi:hypothetical protein
MSRQTCDYGPTYGLVMASKPELVMPAPSSTWL